MEELSDGCAALRRDTTGKLLLLSPVNLQS